MGFNREMWLQSVLIALISYGGALKTINFKVDGAQNGKVTIPVFNAGADAEIGDTDTDFEGLSKSFVEVDTKEDAHKGWTVSRKEAESTDIDLVGEAATQGVDLVMSAVEKNIFAHAAANATGAKVQFTGLVSGDTTLTYENILEASYLLDIQKCPEAGRFMLVSPKKYRDLKKIKDTEGNYIFVKNEKTDDKVLKTGVVGFIDNFTVVKSANAPKLTVTGTHDYAVDANNTQEAVLFYHESSIVAAVDENQVYVFAAENPTTRGWDTTIQLLFGKNEARPAWIVSARDNTPVVPLPL